MSSENKALVRRWFEEVWNHGNAGAIDEMLDRDCKVHGFGDEPVSRDGFREVHATYREAFPDVHIEVDDIIAEGDLVAARWTVTGTHRGTNLGFAATHRPARFSGMVFARIRNGRMVEGWNTFDQLGMLQQLGAAPSTLPPSRR